MSALSVVAQDDRSSVDVPDRGAARPRGRLRGQAPAAITPAADEPQHPRVVLQLPDLSTASRSRRVEQFRYAPQIYWAAIALGALLALWLVMSGKKTPERSTEEAPSWTQSLQTQAPPMDCPAPTAPQFAAPQNGAPVFTARSSDAAAPAPPATARPGEAAPLGIGPGVIP